MRKLALALVCLVSVAFFASCDPTIENPEPSIAIITGADCITGTVENPQQISVYDTTNWRYGFHVESNAETKKELSRLKVTFEWTANGLSETADTIIDLTGLTTYDFVANVFEEEEKNIFFEMVVRATVTDVDNQSKTAAIAFKVDQPATDLTIYDLNWQRKGSNLQGDTQTEMAAFGLQWLARDPYHANIRPLPGFSLYVFNNDADLFNKVVTDFDMEGFFANLVENHIQPVEEYRNISVGLLGDRAYNDVLATVNSDGYMSLVLIEKANVQTGNYGVWTTITAKGK